MSSARRPQLVVLAWGNTSRGDDAAGPLMAQKLIALDRSEIEVIEDLQLHIEHVMDLHSDVPVLFIDASVAIETGFSVEKIGPVADNSYSTHTVSPQALLHLFEKTHGQKAPEAWVLHICGRSFELGEEVSAETTQYVEDAWQYLSSATELPGLAAIP